jgi:Zn-finger protein
VPERWCFVVFFFCDQAKNGEFIETSHHLLFWNDLGFLRDAKW